MSAITMRGGWPSCLDYQRHFKR